ncbi:Oidioi.mRNA.OKI2018_I69.XSR.g16343.t1.cds [Oikopleura dioica]|uniref:Oidioi.mRNA.OKI2018_I69.XSR.g16343.t1.cds n=1 Tax=Oikopleura dioica TaxID=34765 RepID=A0ABN7SKW2_OIKDI|nr:Oidioi.mRNA.OKI2018_I69.XSR.g16343.t1.cds [Oikopleura dioica]
MNQQQSESSKKRKIDVDDTTNPAKKSKSVEGYVQHLRVTRDIFAKRHDKIMKMQVQIEEMSRELQQEQKTFAVDVAESKKESAEKIPDGIVQDPNLFAFSFSSRLHPKNPNMAFSINRHIRKIEGDPKKAFLDFLNGQWRFFTFDFHIKGIGKTYKAQLKEALPIEDFQQIEKILGKKRASTIANEFCSYHFREFEK